MKLPTNRLDDPARLRELRRLNVLDTADEQFFDDLTRLAAEMFEAPIALISLIDEKRQWFKSRFGTDLRETPRELAFCAHTVDLSLPMVITDASKDPRFVAHPYVIDDPKIRFYAGAPLISEKGLTVGTLCVIDSVPKSISPLQVEQLVFMARQVMALLEQRVLRQPR